MLNVAADARRRMTGRRTQPRSVLPVQGDRKASGYCGDRNSQTTGIHAWTESEKRNATFSATTNETHFTGRGATEQF